MAKTLRIISYKGTWLGALRLEYIEDLLNSQNVDILLIQESWLLSKTMYKLTADWTTLWRPSNFMEERVWTLY